MAIDDVVKNNEGSGIDPHVGMITAASGGIGVGAGMAAGLGYSAVAPLALGLGAGYVAAKIIPEEHHVPASGIFSAALGFSFFGPFGLLLGIPGFYLAKKLETNYG